MSRFVLNLDSTQLDAYWTCPEFWRLAHKELLQKRHAITTARDYGTIIHGLLERYYLHRFKGETQQDAEKFAIHALEQDAKKLGIDKDQTDFLKLRFLLYTQYYNANDFKIVGHQDRAGVEVGFTYVLVDDPNFLFTLEGKIDLIAQWCDRIYIVDHKTQARKRNYYERRIQFKNYCLALGANHFCVNYIGLQKSPNKDTFRRQVTYISAAELQIWKKELIRKYFEIAYTIMENGKFEHCWSACEGKFGYPCEMVQICEQITKNRKDHVINEYFEKRPEFIPWMEEELK